MRAAAKGISHIPSVIGGVRPNARDDIEMTRRSISYTRALLEAAVKRAEELKEQLARDEAILKAARVQCKNCKSCTACV